MKISTQATASQQHPKEGKNLKIRNKNKISTKMRQLITKLNPKSPISEQYRTLRTNLQFSVVDKELKAIIVTSSDPGAGKSITAANLRSEEHTSELQSRGHLVCRLLLE